jgi:hypothetical protein
VRLRPECSGGFGGDHHLVAAALVVADLVVEDFKKTKVFFFYN